MESWVIAIILSISGTIIAVIGFFLRNVYGNISKNIESLTFENQKRIEEQGRLKGKIELIEQEHRLKYQLIEETTQHEIKNMANKVGQLSDVVGDLVRIQMGASSRRRTNN